MAALLATLSGCGEESDAASDSRGSEQEAAAGSGAASAGMGAGGSAGSAPAAGSSTGSCSGTFGRALPVMIEDSGYSMTGISLTGDELELFYARSQAGAPPSVVRRTRTDKDAFFGTLYDLPELAMVCEPEQLVNPDVSEDGLTLYVTCTQIADTGMSEGVSTLRVARRPDRTMPFSLEAEPIGGVFASAGLSSDELTAYTDGEIFDTAPQMFRRASKTESFGEAEPVPGIDTALNSLDISSDGLSLFGSANPVSGTDNANAIFRALRSDPQGNFSAPAQLDLQVFHPGVGAPNITPSCTLYLIVVQPLTGYMIHAAGLQ